MNPAFHSIIAASETDRRDVFLTAANRLGTTIQNVEKDFWVCWTLDALFNGLPEGEPRLLFKGGTSLSKAFGLISRFSEDIDITVFRQDIGQPASIEELESLSGKKRRARLDAIRDACRAYIDSPLLENLTRVVRQTMREAGIFKADVRVEVDEADESRQSLLFWYPSVVETPGEYVRSAVKIEAGAKSALDPHQSAIIVPYIADDLPDLNLRVERVTTVNPERTFWDKIVILHGQRRWFEQRGELRHGGQRVSRHYYDVFKLAESDAGKRALADTPLGADCARHARMFFFSADYDLEHAVPGTLAILPTSEMRSTLQRDYQAMAGMIFGEIPSFEDVMTLLSRLEKSLNQPK
ncbi:nucleotidyl transferase AbiEii/AbiGii toxin family protein [soil metagenome]